MELENENILLWIGGWMDGQTDTKKHKHMQQMRARMSKSMSIKSISVFSDAATATRFKRNFAQLMLISFAEQPISAAKFAN